MRVYLSRRVLEDVSVDVSVFRCEGMVGLFLVEGEGEVERVERRVERWVFMRQRAESSDWRGEGGGLLLLVVEGGGGGGEVEEGDCIGV